MFRSFPNPRNKTNGKGAPVLYTVPSWTTFRTFRAIRCMRAAPPSWSTAPVPTLPTNAACPRASSMPTHSSPMRTPPDPVGDLLDSARLVTKYWRGRTAKARFQALLALESAGPPARAGRDEYNPLSLIRASGQAIYYPASRFLLFSDDYVARLFFSGLL